MICRRDNYGQLIYRVRVSLLTYSKGIFLINRSGSYTACGFVRKKWLGDGKEKGCTLDLSQIMSFTLWIAWSFKIKGLFFPSFPKCCVFVAAFFARTVLSVINLGLSQGFLSLLSPQAIGSCRVCQKKRTYSNAVSVNTVSLFI